MRRRLFNFAAGCSFWIFVATIALWGRAQWHWVVEGPVIYTASADDGFRTGYRFYNGPFGIEFTRQQHHGERNELARWEWAAARVKISSFTPAPRYSSPGDLGIGVYWHVSVLGRTALPAALRAILLAGRRGGGARGRARWFSDLVIIEFDEIVDTATLGHARRRRPELRQRRRRRRRAEPAGHAAALNALLVTGYLLLVNRISK